MSTPRVKIPRSLKDLRKTAAFVTTIVSVAVITACATSPLGRNQLIIVPDSQMDEMGAKAFQEMKSKQKLDSDPGTRAFIQCIVNPLTRMAQDQTPVSNWEVVVFDDKQANAFALPGGKIGVYTGLLRVAKNDAQLAAVIGHEIGHVIARHSAERVSQQASSQLGLAALGKIAGDNPKSNLLMGLLGVGAQLGILLPYSRTQESEADLIGLDLMARAGFDPTQSVALWQNMITEAGGKGPPQFLSTHPASENRIAALQEKMAEAMSKYNPAPKTSCKR